jgi:hypothetical protein
LKKNRTLANAPRADEGNTLTVSQQAKNLFDFGISSMEVARTADSTTMEEWIVHAHIDLIVMRNGKNVNKACHQTGQLLQSI